jgi:hypothetical protein
MNPAILLLAAAAAFLVLGKREEEEIIRPDLPGSVPRGSTLAGLPTDVRGGMPVTSDVVPGEYADVPGGTLPSPRGAPPGAPPPGAPPPGAPPPAPPPPGVMTGGPSSTAGLRAGGSPRTFRPAIGFERSDVIKRREAVAATLRARVETAAGGRHIAHNTARALWAELLRQPAINERFQWRLGAITGPGTAGTYPIMDFDTWPADIRETLYAAIEAEAARGDPADLARFVGWLRYPTIAGGTVTFDDFVYPAPGNTETRAEARAAWEIYANELGAVATASAGYARPPEGSPMGGF